MSSFFFDTFDQRLSACVEIFVVTDMSKNGMRKTEYRLSTNNQDDFWAKLKRSEAKNGLEFTPLRKVLFLDKQQHQQLQQVQEISEKSSVKDQ